MRAAAGRGIEEQADAFVYGRVVWEMMSGFWPQAESMSDDPHDLEFAPVWRAKPKIVFSRTLTRADWNTTVLDGDLTEEVTKLKEQPGKDLLLSGGSSLPAALTARGLIDEYHVVVHPVVLGGGKPLFLAPPERVNLELVETRAFDGRTVLLRYRRTGA